MIQSKSISLDTNLCKLPAAAGITQRTKTAMLQINASNLSQKHQSLPKQMVRERGIAPMPFILNTGID